MGNEEDDGDNFEEAKESVDHVAHNDLFELVE